MLKIALSISLVILSLMLLFVPIQVFESAWLNAIKVLFALIAALTAAFLVFNKSIVDPESCKQNWCVVLTILGSVALIIGENRAGLLVISTMLLGVGINYLLISIRLYEKQQKKDCANV